MFWLWWVLGWLLVSVFVYWVHIKRGWHANPCLVNGRTLFVTAHPDDECMFFAPTILALTENHPEKVYLLCLSCGDYRKEGAVRKSELFASAVELGIRSENVTVMHSSHFPDDPEVDWDAGRLAQVIRYHMDTLDITVVVSFDENGVSGHANHIAIATALRDMKWPQGCRVFLLDSVNFIRKYSSFLDLLPTTVTSLYVHLASPMRRRRALKAMAAHKSQMVWFRRLYLVFSRYMLLNTFTELTDELALKIS